MSAQPVSVESQQQFIASVEVAVEPEEFKGFSNSKDYPKGYIPSGDEKGYMNKQQSAYFRDMMFSWKAKLLKEDLDTVEDLREYSSIEPDPADQAIIETQQAADLKTRDRARKLIRKIDQALTRLEEGEFGYCEETGDPIGIARLLARPIATLCIEAKRRQEQQETGYAG